jgi:hypothetical protein
MFLLLKYKLSKIQKDIDFSSDEKTYLQNSFKEWFTYYESVESINSVDQFYSILNSLIQSKKNQKLDLKIVMFMILLGLVILDFILIILLCCYFCSPFSQANGLRHLLKITLLLINNENSFLKLLHLIL